MAEYIKKEDLLNKAYWHGRYTVQNSYLTGGEAVDVEDIKKMETIDVIPYSIKSDGTLIITIPKGIKVDRVLVQEDKTH